jgi:hypothetical protein
MKDLRATLDKLLTDANDCELISKLATNCHKLVVRKARD